MAGQKDQGMVLCRFRVRPDRLQRRFGDAGHGLVPVGVPFALYEHADLELSNGPEWRLGHAFARALLRGYERR